MSATLLYGKLDLNDKTTYFLVEEGFKYPSPTLKQQYADSALTHGQLPTESWKWNNRDLTFNILIHGTDIDGLQTALRTLYSTVYAENSIVTWCMSGGQRTFYFLAYRPDAVATDSFFRTVYRAKNEAVVTWTVQGFPFGHIDRQYLTPAKNLRSNDSFEKHSGDDFDGWVRSASVTANSTQYLTGGISALFTAYGSIADMDYLPREGVIDTTHHYNAKCFAQKLDGSPDITITLYCFDADENQLAILTLLDASVPATGNWMEVIRGYGTSVITPEMWPVGTTSVKREIATTTGTATFDSLIFEDSEYLQDNKLEGAFVIDIPQALGDVPANAQITVGSAFCSGPFSSMHSGTAVGLAAINGYSASDIWAVGGAGEILFYNGSTWAPQTGASVHSLLGVSALDSTHVWAVGAVGTIELFNGTSWAQQTYPTVNPILPDPGFEGTFSTYWLPEVNTYGTTITQDATHHWGSASLKFYNSGARTVRDQITSKATNRVAINPTVNYKVSCWTFTTRPNSDWGFINAYMSVMFYDSAGNYLGSKTRTPWPSDETWHQHSIDMTPADYPAGTHKIGIQFQWSGRISDVSLPIDLYFDDILVTQTSNPHLRGVYSLPSNTLVAVGDGGTIIRSPDSGGTWTQESSGTLWDLSAVSGSGTGPHFVAVGQRSTILTSNDAVNWTVRPTTSRVDLYGVFMLDWVHIWAVGAEGTILFSADGGDTWTRQASGVTTNLHAIYGYDSTHVWAVGDNGLILTFDGMTWSFQAGSSSGDALFGVYAIADNQVWVVGSNGTILKGVSTTGSMPMTNLIIGQRAAYATNFAPIQDAYGTTQERDVYRRGGIYRSLATGGTHKFRYPVGAHRGRYILSIGTSWASTTTHDQLTVKLYLETAGGTKISATDIALPALDLGDPSGAFKETAFHSPRLIDITIPSHYISPTSNQDNIYQVIEVSNDPSAPDEWLDCCTLIPVDCAVELSGMANNFIIMDSEEGMVLSSQDGTLDTAAAFDPQLTVDTPRFVINPSGTQMVVLAGNIVSGDDQLSPLLDISISYEPQYWLIPE